MLFENSRGVSLADGIDELVIVPDGWLWYLPFEILPVASNQAGDDRRPLREVCRIRYAPTRSLAVLRFRAAGRRRHWRCCSGRLTRGEKPEAAMAAAGEMLAGVDGAAVSSRRPAAPRPPWSARCSTRSWFSTNWPPADSADGPGRCSWPADGRGGDDDRRLARPAAEAAAAD